MISASRATTYTFDEDFTREELIEKMESRGVGV
jgi:hypothetical protein